MNYLPYSYTVFSHEKNIDVEMHLLHLICDSPHQPHHLSKEKERSNDYSISNLISIIEMF